MFLRTSREEQEKIPYQMLRQRETHAVAQKQWKPVGKATIDRVRRKSSTTDKSKATRRERVLTTQELDRLKKEVDQCKEKLEGIRGEVGKTKEALGVQRAVFRAQKKAILEYLGLRDRDDREQ